MGALLTGDILQVVADRQHVSFMYSYPNFIPLPASAIQKITKALAPFAYDRVYGAFLGSGYSNRRSGCGKAICRTISVCNW